jgi:hypothetical protein
MKYKPQLNTTPFHPFHSIQSSFKPSHSINHHQRTRFLSFHNTSSSSRLSLIRSTINVFYFLFTLPFPALTYVLIPTTPNNLSQQSTKQYTITTTVKPSSTCSRLISSSLTNYIPHQYYVPRPRTHHINFHDFRLWHQASNSTAQPGFEPLLVVPTSQLSTNRSIFSRYTTRVLPFILLLIPDRSTRLVAAQSSS